MLEKLTPASIIIALTMGNGVATAQPNHRPLLAKAAIELKHVGDYKIDAETARRAKSAAQTAATERLSAKAAADKAKAERFAAKVAAEKAAAQALHHKAEAERSVSQVAAQRAAVEKLKAKAVAEQMEAVR